MAYLISGSSPPGSVFRTFSLRYVATGSEGTDFDVPLGSTMADTSYSVTCSSAGGVRGDGTESSGVDVPDMPVAGRTTTEFRVLLGQALASGDILEFTVAGMVSV